mmetsp:Transcript_99309/g.281091  ORF Transcript_99309/g.281091 Transcript_99309/m.281091 type:complete len:426 (+) Transcript_99309:1609-2886(+)
MVSTPSPLDHAGRVVPGVRLPCGRGSTPAELLEPHRVAVRGVVDGPAAPAGQLRGPGRALHHAAGPEVLGRVLGLADGASHALCLRDAHHNVRLAVAVQVDRHHLARPRARVDRDVDGRGQHGLALAGRRRCDAALRLRLRRGGLAGRQGRQRRDSADGAAAGVLHAGSAGVRSDGSPRQLARLHQDSVAVAPQRYGQRVLRAEVPAGDLVAFLERLRGLLELLQALPLHGQRVVRDGEHRELVLRHLVWVLDLDSPVDEVQRVQGVLDRPVVLVQLGQDGADVEVRPCEGDLVRAQVGLHLESPPQVAQGAVELADLLVVQTEVVAGHCQQARRPVHLRGAQRQDRLCLLELVKRCLHVALAEGLHALLVAGEHRGGKLLRRRRRHGRRDVLSPAGGRPSPGGCWRGGPQGRRPRHEARASRGP